MLGVMNAIAHASAAPARGPKLDNRRVLAGIVDLAIVALGAAVILFAGDALSSDAGEIRGALGAVILGWALYYYFALESGDGQTVGKKLMKLRVVRADGSPAGMREVAVRTILRVVDGVGGYIVGLIVMLATGEKRQRLGDLAAGTIVVDATGASVAPAVKAPVADEAPAEAGEEIDAPEADAGAEQPEAEADADKPEADTKTITLPSRPAPPATLADLTAPETPAVPEMRPFPPVAEEAVAEEPVVEEPLPEIASPSIEELAHDVATVQAEPAADVVEPEPVMEAEPVVEAEAEEPVEDGPVTVKSVETVSAIDLIMGGGEETEDDADEPQEPASA